MLSFVLSFMIPSGWRGTVPAEDGASIEGIVGEICEILCDALQDMPGLRARNDKRAFSLQA